MRKNFAMQFILDIPFEFPGGVKKTFDLILPEDREQTVPLLVWIHGGGWSAGEKRVYNDFERFTLRGYAVLSIDYRFSGDAPFPAQILDCKAAVRWARANAERYGYDARRILVGGSSAGGHLAALMGTTNGHPEFDREGGYTEYSSDVQGVVDLFGPADLHALCCTGERAVLDESVAAFLRSDSMSLAEMAVSATPQTYIDGSEPPFLIIHGTLDPTVPISQSEGLYRALKASGCDAEFLAVEGGGHGFDTVEVYEALSRFIETKLPKTDRSQEEIPHRDGKARVS